MTLTTGFNDNGSGVAVMLEIARVLTRGKCFQPDYTILFTAFDSEEDGSFGSQEFLNKIIVPHFIRQGVNIQVCKNFRGFQIDDCVFSKVASMVWIESDNLFYFQVLNMDLIFIEQICKTEAALKKTKVP